MDIGQTHYVLRCKRIAIWYPIFKGQGTVCTLSYALLPEAKPRQEESPTSKGARTNLVSTKEIQRLLEEVLSLSFALEVDNVIVIQRDGIICKNLTGAWVLYTCY